MKNKKIAICSGGMDPLHPGHLRMLEAAKEMSEYLIVALNSDEWLVRKKGRAFMPFEYRMEIINGIGCVDEVIAFDDSDNTAIDAIRTVVSMYPDSKKIMFCNGGDCIEGNVPEADYANEANVELVYGVGGENKLAASSVLLNDYAYPLSTRPWGSFKVLYNSPDYKLKELIINPGSAISLQYHYHRREFWMVVEGTGRVNIDGKDQIITVGQHVIVEVGQTHKLLNPGKLPLRIVEIQQGDYLEEDDIVRLDLDTLQKNDKYKGT